MTLALVLPQQLQVERARVVASRDVADVLAPRSRLVVDFHVTCEVALVDKVLVADMTDVGLGLCVVGQLVGDKGRTEFEAPAADSAHERTLFSRVVALLMPEKIALVCESFAAILHLTDPSDAMIIHDVFVALTLRVENLVAAFFAAREAILLLRCATSTV